MSFSLRFLKNPLYRFLFTALAVYVLWYILYELWLHPKEHLDIWVIQATLRTALLTLNLLGYNTFSGDFRLMGIDGTSGLWMGDNCDSLELFVLFTGFILAFPGPWKHKIWYIPAGIAVIFLANVFRMIALAVIQKNCSAKWLDFNHTYTFTILVYGIIFALWFYWVKKLASPELFLKKGEEK